jgi:hypothetical protein
MPATPPPAAQPPRITLTLGLEETNLVLEALGQLPFARVYQLIAAVQEQAHRQLAEQQPAHRPAEQQPAEPRSADRPTDRPADGGTPA